jgi:hypothetical protein
VLTEFRKLRYDQDARVTFAAVPGCRWATRQVLRELFKFAFETWGCTRLTSIVSEKNQKAIKLNRQAGWRKCGVVPRGYDGRTNAIVYSMLRDQCPWLAEDIRTAKRETTNG